MEWIDAVSHALEFIEQDLTQPLTVQSVAKQVNCSPFYFEKGFTLLCGMTVGEYVRKRRLSAAGSELTRGDAKVIELALKYGYDSPDSFTKAFTRFHGVTPAGAKKAGRLKAFAPLKIKFILEGGNPMEYRITEKHSFTVLGNAKTIRYEDAKVAIPQFWQQHYASGKGQTVCGCFGINIDATMGNEQFEYLIADLYNPAADVPQGFTVRQIPAFTWAVFPCRGKMPEAFQRVNKQIFTDWLPNNRDYEFCAGYCIEMYDDPQKYQGGVQSDDYYSELWIPVKKK